MVHSPYQFTSTIIADAQVLLSARPVGLLSWVGQNHMYTVYIRYFLQGFHQIYGHIRRIYTVLANQYPHVHINHTGGALGRKSTQAHNQAHIHRRRDIHRHTQTYVHIQTQTYTYTQLYRHTHKYTDTDIHKTHVPLIAHKSAPTHTCTRTRTHTHTHTHMHTHTHTDTHLWKGRQVTRGRSGAHHTLATLVRPTSFPSVLPSGRHFGVTTIAACDGLCMCVRACVRVCVCVFVCVRVCVRACVC